MAILLQLTLLALFLLSSEIHLISYSALASALVATGKPQLVLSFYASATVRCRRHTVTESVHL